MEEKIFFQSQDLQLEGLLGKGTGTHGVVISHPHTLFGGDMNNLVVECIRKVYMSFGYTTLRFNFRGAGKSQGSFDEGKGEQIDILSAVDCLKKYGVEQVDLAGYSFGAWVNALAFPKQKDIKRKVMVAPPVAFIDFKNIGDLSALSLIVSGSLDEYAPPKLIRKMIPIWNPSAHLEVIEGADHFFFGYTGELDSGLSKFL